MFITFVIFSIMGSEMTWAALDAAIAQDNLQSAALAGARSAAQSQYAADTAASAWRGAKTAYSSWKQGGMKQRVRDLYSPPIRHPTRGTSKFVSGRGPNYRRGYASKYRGITVGERKFHDVTINNGDGNTVVATAGNIQNSGTIIVIPQGATEITRVGRKAVIRQINWRYHSWIESGTNLNASSAFLRIILYWDKQANKATAAVLDILETANWQSFRNLANGERFEILLDRTEDLLCKGVAGNGTSNDFLYTLIRGEYFKKCEIPIEYNSTTGAIGEITSSNLGILLISSAAYMKFDSRMRMRFTDS